MCLAVAGNADTHCPTENKRIRVTAEQLVPCNHTCSPNPRLAVVTIHSPQAPHSETGHLVGIWAILLSLVYILYIYVFWQKQISAGNITFYKKNKHISNYKTHFFNLLFLLFFPLSIPSLLPNRHLYIFLPTCLHNHTLPFIKGRNSGSIAKTLGYESIQNKDLGYFFFSLEMCNIYVYFS